MISVVNFFSGMIFWTILLLLTSFLLANFWVRIFSSKKYQIFTFPGIIIHEISHVLGCLLTGAKIEEVKFFSPRGGYVKHRKPRLSIIGLPIIGMFPVIGGTLSLFFLLKFFNFDFPETILFSGSVYEGFIQLIRSSFLFIANYWSFGKFWIFTYFAISIMICLIPSRQDLKNSFVGLTIITIILGAFINFNLFVDEIDFFINYYLSTVLIIGVFFGIVTLAMTVPIYLIKKLI